MTPQNPRRISPSAFLEPKVKDPKSRFWHSPHLCVGGVQSGDAFFCLNFGPKTPLFKLLYLVLGVDVIPGGVFRGGGAPPRGGYYGKRELFRTGQQDGRTGIGPFTPYPWYRSLRIDSSISWTLLKVVGIH